ncbi:MAG: hypothetical protein NZM04_06395 [Methylacidiphilales bacterium]|nr:hypothetical protein [Candidatus Methylacidiphilales bacterium]
MKRFWSIVKGCVMVWGVISGIGAICLAGVIAYNFGPGNVSKSDFATANDVRHILNWCELGDDRIEEVVHSYQSARSLTGDHLDAYAIRITHLEIEERSKKDWGRGWYRCDQVEGVLKDAIEFISGWLHNDKIPWFLTSEEIRSDEVYVYPRSTYSFGTRPISARLIFVRPRDRMLFYISC